MYRSKILCCNEVTGNKRTWKKLLAGNFSKFSNREEGQLQIGTLFLPVTFLLSTFSHFSERF
jgi:hypothetical protein